MVSLFFLFLNQGGEDPFYREREASLSCKFPMWDCLPQRKKNLSLKIWGLQICPSSIEFMSVTNMNNEVKRKCEK